MRSLHGRSELKLIECELTSTHEMPRRVATLAAAEPASTALDQRLAARSTALKIDPLECAREALDALQLGDSRPHEVSLSLEHPSVRILLTGKTRPRLGASRRFASELPAIPPSPDPGYPVRRREVQVGKRPYLVLPHNERIPLEGLPDNYEVVAQRA
jgi:hypothetical protein